LKWIFLSDPNYIYSGEKKMIETVAIIFALCVHYLLLDRRITRLESDVAWLKKMGGS